MLGRSFLLHKTWFLIDLTVIIGMASVDAANSLREETMCNSHSSDETTLIVMAAPSVKNSYYRTVFNQIIDYMANFANLVRVSEPERTQIIDELEKSFPGVKIIEIPDYYQYATWKGFTSACNVFVNAIVTDQYIYMPTFNGPHDASMFNLIQSHTTKNVIAVPAEKVCFMGGSVRCLSWQVKGELKKKILNLTRREQEDVIN
ncbi:unnamed protein product [Rotaria sordida]|uniref:Agmatine deiminase n=1 Tax=Rotaria sordida TaxID=392033 RepID=A0A813T5U5_9BILA|nr:unnamed protein product [Rotaria sordida]